MMNKDTATKWQKAKAFMLGAIVVDIQTIIAAWVLMLIIGVIHHDLIPAVQPASYMACIVVLFLSQVFYTLIKFTIDFR